MQDDETWDEPEEHNRGLRAPRRLSRLVRLDAEIDTVLAKHLDRIDRKAPLPEHTVDAVFTLLARAKTVQARLPRRARQLAFPPGPLRPADALIALLKLRETIDAEGERLLARFEPIHLPDAVLPGLDAPLTRPAGSRHHRRQ